MEKPCGFAGDRDGGGNMSAGNLDATMTTGRIDERLRRVSIWRRLMVRPELGAVAGTILVYIFFFAVAGNSGMFSARGILNFLEVSAQLGLLASVAALLMIAGEFDLSVGSMIAFSGVVIAIPATGDEAGIRGRAERRHTLMKLHLPLAGKGFGRTLRPGHQQPRLG